MSSKIGDKERVTLRLSAVPAQASGHQLAVQADDPSGTIDTLRYFYGALFNGGCVNDALHYNFGNEPDGWYYGGASWMKGLPLLAGSPAPDAAAAHPQILPHAFRDNLQMILGTEYEPGRTRFGYNSAGAYTDDNLNQILGGRAYYLYSGDLAFVRQHLPAYRRAVAWYLGNRNADGLVALKGVSHWYYDAMYASGVTTYHNAFLYRACSIWPDWSVPRATTSKPPCRRPKPRSSRRPSTAFCGGKKRRAGRAMSTGSCLTVRRLPTRPISASSRRWPSASHPPHRRRNSLPRSTNASLSWNAITATSAWLRAPPIGRCPRA